MQIRPEYISSAISGGLPLPEKRNQAIKNIGKNSLLKKCYIADGRKIVKRIERLESSLDLQMLDPVFTENDCHQITRLNVLSWVGEHHEVRLAGNRLVSSLAQRTDLGRGWDQKLRVGGFMNQVRLDVTIEKDCRPLRVNGAVAKIEHVSAGREAEGLSLDA